MAQTCRFLSVLPECLCYLSNTTTHGLLPSKQNNRRFNIVWCNKHIDKLERQQQKGRQHTHWLVILNRILFASRVAHSTPLHSTHTTHAKHPSSKFVNYGEVSDAGEGPPQQQIRISTSVTVVEIDFKNEWRTIAQALRHIHVWCVFCVSIDKEEGNYWPPANIDSRVLSVVRLLTNKQTHNTHMCSVFDIFYLTVCGMSGRFSYSSPIPHVCDTHTHTQTLMSNRIEFIVIIVYLPVCSCLCVCICILVLWFSSTVVWGVQRFATMCHRLRRY